MTNRSGPLIECVDRMRVMMPPAAPIASQLSRLVGAATIALLTLASGAFAQSVPKPAATPSAASPGTPAAAASTPTRPQTRQRIELSPADRSAIEKANTEPASTTRPDDGLVPTAADLTAPLIEDRQTRIEQVRTSNRISEVIVSPALGGPGFVMTNRDGRQPLTQTDMGGGLSVPKFFRWEFGSPAPAPLALPPPPPTR